MRQENMAAEATALRRASPACRTLSCPWNVCDQGITASKIKHEILLGFIITVGWLKQGEQTNVRVAETNPNLC